MTDVYRDTLRDNRIGFIVPERVSISVVKAESVVTGLRK